MQRHTPDPCKHKHVFSPLAFSSSPACWYLEIRIERGFRVMESGPLSLQGCFTLDVFVSSIVFEYVFLLSLVLTL